MKLVIVLEAGGMRNAFTSGVLTVLWTYGLRSHHVRSIYACSSGTATALFFSSNQPLETSRIWKDQLTSLRALNPARPLWRSPPGDLDYVVDKLLEKLDLKELEECPTKHVFNTLDVNTGVTHYVEWFPGDNDLIKASSSLPVISRRISYNEMSCVDGGVSDPFPFEAALLREQEEEVRYLVIRNLPMSHRDEKKTRLQAWAMFPYAPKAREALLRRSQLHHVAMSKLNQLIQKGEAFAIAPQRQSCSRFTRNPRRIAFAEEQGKLAALQALHQRNLGQFLSEVGVRPRPLLTH